MCLIVFKYQPDEHCKLLLISNRDEYHQRKTLPANYWPNHPVIFGGIDGEAGGSWLSTDTSGRLAAVTNVRKPPFVDNNKQSRGQLVSDFLKQELPAKDFINILKLGDGEYGLFNLLLMDSTGLWHYSNDSHQIQKVSVGIHGLCNATLDSPWPKLIWTTAQFENVLANDTIDYLQLLSVMQSQYKPPDSEMPDTGVGLECERFLSSVFVKGDDYGTRCTTLLTINNESTDFLELSYSPNGMISGEVNKKIALN